MSTRWNTWRRDLICTLAGAVVAAAVLIPLWESRVQAIETRIKEIEDIERKRDRLRKTERDRQAAEIEVRRVRAEALTEKLQAEAKAKAANEGQP